jgi:hypothetical protein
MPKSNVDCKRIKEINCFYSDDNRLCPDDCIGFINKNGEEKIIEEPINKNKRR